jgi:hypothetical protein
MALVFLGWLLGGFVAPGVQSQPGLRIVIQETFGTTTVETIHYVLEDRSRVEFRHADHRSASIVRCDAQRTIFLNYDDRSFMSGPLPVRSMTTAKVSGSIRRAQPQLVSQTAPRLLIETTTTRTGEYKTMFGFNARRVITTERRIPVDGKNADSTETETDGWYVDLETRPACDRVGGAYRAVAVGGITRAGAARPEFPVITFKEIGTPERGFPIETTMKTRSLDHTGVTRTVVRELSRELLDPALFEIPPGFHDAEGLFGRVNAQLFRAWQAVAAWFRAGD